MDRITALKAIARNLGDLKLESTVASAAGSALYANDFIFTDPQQMMGQYVYIDSGGAAGQERLIGSIHAANKNIFLPQAWGTIPSTNATFIILSHFSKKDYDGAIDRAIGFTRTKYLLDKVATLQLVASQYEYAVPSGFEYISTLRLVPSGNSDYGNDAEVDTVFELRPRYWRIEQNAVGTYIIAIDPRKIDLNVLDNEWIRVIGQVKPDIPTGTDNAVIPAELEEFIIAFSSMQLASQRINENKEWTQKFSMFRGQVQGDGQLEDYITRYGYGRKVKP